MATKIAIAEPRVLGAAVSAWLAQPDPVMGDHEADILLEAALIAAGVIGQDADGVSFEVGDNHDSVAVILPTGYFDLFVGPGQEAIAYWHAEAE